MVLFNSGTEFLVCKVEQKGNIKHVYVRNINLGFSNQHTVLWVDDQVFSTRYAKYFAWINRARVKKDSQDRQDVQYVTKSFSIVAQAYIQSKLFQVAV